MKLIFIVGESGGDYFAVNQCIENGLIDAEIIYMLSLREESKAILHFSENNSAKVFIDKDKDTFFNHLELTLKTLEFDYLILSGFKYMIPRFIVDKYKCRIINSHHSLLPAHPGLFLKEEIVESDDKFLGATVHFVDEGIDTGLKIIQAVFPNYGLLEFDRILKIYRFIQDILIVQVLRDFSEDVKKTRVKKISSYDEILFCPKVDLDIIEEFRRTNLE